MIVRLIEMARRLRELIYAVKPKRTWLQFRLRTIIVLLAFLCLPLAWMANRSARTRPQREALPSSSGMDSVAVKSLCLASAGSLNSSEVRLSYDFVAT